jgi:gliding motility-associated-like protein
MRKLGRYHLIFLLCHFATAADFASAQITAQFSSNITNGCAPLVVRFKDESTGNPTAWKWDLGNGTVSYFQDPSATYFNPGTYSVKLVISNVAGTDSIFKLHYITVFASPVVDFSASDTGGCYPLKVVFNDRSTAGDGTIQKWLWDFGDGNTDSSQHPQHIYTALGNFNVSLQVRNSNGYVSTKTRANYIQLKNGVKAGFKYNVPNNCRPPTAINFINESSGTGILSYQWDFGDGGTSTLPNPVHIYNTAGTYTVKIVVRNNAGCIDSLVKIQAITIGTVTAEFSEPAAICAGQSFQLINRSQPNPTGAYWDFGDGSVSTVLNPFKVYASGGIYAIKLISDFGACKDSISKTITVLDKPSADFTATNRTACKPPLTTSFSSSTTGATSFKWFFGDGDSSSLENPTHIYNTPGEYDVILVAKNDAGCTDTIRRNAFVRIQPPQASISNIPAEGCEPFTFIPTSVVQSLDSIVHYRWDFGDGIIQDGLSPLHIYPAGTYSLKLIVTSAGGCTDTVEAPAAIRVGTKPNPSFSATPRYTCAFQQISFTDLTSGPVDSWMWYFGDGGTSTDSNPTHFYQDTGYFDVLLIVKNNGCEDSIRINDYVHIRPPIAKFIDSSGCDTKFSRKFIDQSIGALSWNWNFGDGTTSTEQNPVHIFPSPGTYTVQLTVRNDTCEHTTSREILVIVESADFVSSDTVVCKRVQVQFNARNLNSSHIANYQWDFGDGVIQYGGSSVSHSYISPGKYDVRLIITDINGCGDTLMKPQYIQVDGPTADFTSRLPAACLLQNVIFDDSSVTDGSHAIERWIWNYGDGNTDTLNSPPFQHAYASGGDYTVILKVIDSKGCIDSITKRNTLIISSPRADFVSPDTISCEATTISFINLSSGPLLTYQWDFGDGQFSTITNPLHTYLLEGSYAVKLSIKDQYGCKDSIIKNNYVSIRNPVAQFSMSDSVSTCPPLVVNFSNQSQHYSGFEWDFGDGTKSALQNPVHFYTYPGTYHAKMKVISNGGCMDSIMKKIVVRGPQGSFTYDRILGCVPTTVNFVASTKDLVSFIWDFNDGVTISSADSIIAHTYTRMGEYLPKMILKDPQGCQVPIVGKDTIRIFGVNANFGLSRQLVCDSGLVHFRDSSISNDLITNYHWTFGDGTSSSVQHPTHWYGNTGIFPIQLIVTTRHQCKDTIRNLVPLRIVNTPITAIAGDTAACVPAILNFSGLLMNSDTSVLSWQWNFGNNTSSTLQQPNAVSYSQAGTYNVRLILTNAFNCADTAHYPVVVNPLPIVSANEDRVICRYQQTQLEATGAIRFNWSPVSALSCNNCASPVATPDSTEKFVVQGENIYGCIARDSVLITVKQPFKVKTGKGDTLCKGDTYVMDVSGAELYTWSPAIGLDDVTSAHPKARPDTTTLYRVVGRDDSDCFRDTGYVRIIVYPYPLVNAGNDQTIIGGNSVTLSPVISKDVKQIKWMPTKWLSCYDCPSPVASPKQTTKFTVLVSNEGGCVARDDVSIFVVCAEGNLFMPNTFSPNGDGLNDVFYPRGKGIHALRNFRVFNRWGEVVFVQADLQANDIAKGWDGTFNGKLASQDVYVYTIDVICENNFVFSHKGNVALVR